MCMEKGIFLFRISSHSTELSLFFLILQHFLLFEFRLGLLLGTISQRSRIDAFDVSYLLFQKRRSSSPKKGKGTLQEWLK